MIRCKMVMLLQWSMALGLSLLIMNGVMFAYWRDPGWIRRSGNATAGIYEPGRTLVSGTEGFGIHRVDDNGYINRTADLDLSGYALVLGNSQSNGSNVMPDRKWVSLLDDSMRANAESKCKVYNVSKGGADFCDIVSGFTAAISEFGNADTVIIQIINTDYETKKMKDSLIQRNYSPDLCADSIMKGLSPTQQIRNALKNYFPLMVYSYEYRIREMKLDFADAFIYHQASSGDGLADEHSKSEYEKAYRIALQDMFSLLVNNYDGKIIVLNLPTVEIGADGQLECLNSETEKIFAQLCMENGISYLNMSEEYRKYYSEKKIVPYGFSNTRPGHGHLNNDGHKMVADALKSICVQ